MSANETSPTNEAPGTDLPTSSVTPDDAIRELRTLQERLPRMDASLAEGGSLRGQLQHVSPEFIAAAITAAGTTKAVQAALGRSDEALRDEVDLAARWSTVAEEAGAIARSSTVIATVIRQRVGLAALQTYKICEQLQRDVANAALTTHVDEMRRLNKFGRRRRQPPETEPADDPPKTE